jgi:hypothetical protein
MTTRATMPFFLWKHAVGEAVIRANAYPSAEWFEKTQFRRLALMYDSGESYESAAETIAAFGQGEIDNQKFRSRTPLALARKFRKLIAEREDQETQERTP